MTPKSKNKKMEVGDQLGNETFIRKFQNYYHGKFKNCYRKARNP
jgi:hypothetical protein